MVPPLLRGGIVADAPWCPIVLGAMLAATMVRCLADAADAPKIRYFPPRSCVGIVDVTTRR